MQIFRCLAILRRDNSTGSWIFFIWLSFFPPFSLTAVLPPCEIKKEKKKAITQHITMPWSRWETMPHTCTVSNSFGLAFFKSISHYFCWRNPLEHPCGHWRNSSKNLLASKQLLFGFLFSSVFLASLPLELKNGSRGEERSRFQQFISPPTDVSRWPGERRPLTEGQRDTCERQNLTPANAQTHRNAYTHTQLCGVLFAFARPLAPNIDGMFDWPPLAPLRHDVTPTKRHLFREKWLFMCSGPRCETRGESSDMGQKKTLRTRGSKKKLEEEQHGYSQSSW